MKWKTISKIGATNKERTNRMMKMFNKAKVHGPLTGTNELILSSLIVGSLALPLITEADQQEKKEHPRYKLIDLGTFGGPASRVEDFQRVLNNRGALVGVADTANPDPFNPYCPSPNCVVQHAFKWQNGVRTDLGALAAGGSSVAIHINERGQAVGSSGNGLIDPLTGTPEQIAVLWQENGEIVNLGTFGGAGSGAFGINNRGQVVGYAVNSTPDPFSAQNLYGANFLTQSRAFLWENGVMRELGTLGGPDSIGAAINEPGQAIGISYINFTPNDTTGIPTVHPFLWENAKMLDLGSLGGTFGEPAALNNRGDVAGAMNLPGDEITHPFLWKQGTLTDLGTFGGSNGHATCINDAGDVVGVAGFPGGVLHDAFLWRKGVMISLGNLGTTSYGHSINSKGQVVGGSRVSFEPNQIDAFLWENGGPMINLNNLIPADSPLHLVQAHWINERGEITGWGLPPGVPLDDLETRGHAFLLIPVGEE